jgi:hypothetical protein
MSVLPLSSSFTATVSEESILDARRIAPWIARIGLDGVETKGRDVMRALVDQLQRLVGDFANRPVVVVRTECLSCLRPKANARPDVFLSLRFVHERLR